ncbi:MAG: DNA photolyase [Rhodobacteraceae bacterium]|nr:DNA photolyase [Paracoccaceae bacterium]
MPSDACAPPLPTRTAALERLVGFAPKAGRAYAAQRNYDRAGHPDVSGLSPYLRHRILTESEVLQAILARHSLSAAEKFVQEVYWRTYWKGWLELRPVIWAAYRGGVQRALDRLATEAGLRAEWEAACCGETGIEAFDHWARELVETGYLHNHARMWFASIWIFTLRLPWELGADFFLRHLLDGDPASNTLSWRWVGGLQTRGKTYLARPSNIAKYTEGRFRPENRLAPFAPPLDGPAPPAPVALPMPQLVDWDVPTGWLLTEEDLSPGFLRLPHALPVASLGAPAMRSPLAVAEPVHHFVHGAIADCLARCADRVDSHTQIAPQTAAADLCDWAQRHGLRQIVTAYAPVGPVAGLLDGAARDCGAAGIGLVRVMRTEDRSAWPYATHGFFRFKEKIPQFLSELKGLRPVTRRSP